MQQMHHRPLFGFVSRSLFVCLVVVYLAVIVVPAMAQGRPVTSAAVLPITDATGQSSLLLSEKVTDEVALALEGTGQFRVVPRADLERELSALKLSPPLSDQQKVRLGKRLQVDKIVSGTLKSLRLDRKNGRVAATLSLEVFDVDVAAVLEGAQQTAITPPIPGWEGDNTRVINEGIRAVVEATVDEMLRIRTDRGNVDLVDRQGNVTLNIGTNDGLEIGNRLLVMRPVWEPDLEKVVLRKVGIVQVTDVDPRLSNARLVSGNMPRVGDKVYKLYTPPEVVQKITRARSTKNIATQIAALALLVGIIQIGTGPSSNSPTKLTANIAQSHPGGDTYIAVRPRAGNTILQGTQGWLIYRGPTAGFIAEADNNNYLVGAVRGKHLSLYEDHAARQVGLTFTFTWQYIDETGDQADGSVDITYNHLELVEGQTYYYKVRRIHDPIRPQIPLAQAPPEDVSFTVDPEDALSEATRKAAGPVTYFRPPQLQSPTNGLDTVNPADVTFEWSPAEGADLYQVQVYDNPLLNEPAVYKGPIQSSTGEVVMRHHVTGFTFGSNKTYYWVVGARRSGEALPECGGVKGWIRSEVWSFSTPPMPPSPAAGSAAVVAPGGFWGQTPRGK